MKLEGEASSGSPERASSYRRPTLTWKVQPPIISAMTKPSLVALLAITSLGLLLAGTTDRVPVADPVAAFGALQSTDDLAIHRSATELSIGELQSNRTLFTLTSEGLATLSTDLGRPDTGAQARVREMSGPAGEVDFMIAETSRGAQLMITRPGILHPRGLHVLLFDNDDLHVTDGDGGLIYTRRTAPDGALVEQEGPEGCQCMRTTSTSGQVSVEAR
jgi:hypothetical protein